MLGERYVVKKGDSLWRIAADKLGSGTQWPRIWKYNNRADVVRATKRGIPNPDLIYVGQILLIPRLPGTTQAPARAQEPAAVQQLPTAQEHPAQTSAQPLHKGVQTAPSANKAPTLSDRLRTERSPIAFKYRLDDLRWPTQDVGAAIIEIRMTGDVLLMTRKAYPVTYVTSRGEIETQVTKEANHAFGKLIDDTRYIYDPAQKRVTLRSMLVSQSNVPNTIATAIGVEMSSNSPVPKLRAEIRLPKLEGSIDVFRYVAMDVKIVIEITPKAQPPRLDSPQPLRQPVPVPQSGTDWSRVIGIGLIATAGVIVVATLVEDFFTAGAGAADDPASLALAGASFTRGMAMMGAAATALPRANTPANLQLKSTVTLPEKH